MVNELISALNLPMGYLIHKGHLVYCPNGHALGILNPTDGTDYIAVGNPTSESMFTPDPSQEGLDSSFTCKICGTKGATL